MPRDQIAGDAHDGQGGQAEKIDFEQADGFGRLHGKLRHRFQRAARRVFAGDAVQRHQVHERAIGDDDAGGMGVEAWRVMPCSSMAVSTTSRKSGSPLIQRQQFRIAVDVLANGLLAGFLRNKPGGAINQAEIDIERAAADIADGGFCAHGAEGDDGGNFILAIFS